MKKIISVLCTLSVVMVTAITFGMTSNYTVKSAYAEDDLSKQCIVARNVAGNYGGNGLDFPSAFPTGVPESLPIVYTSENCSTFSNGIINANGNGLANEYIPLFNEYFANSHTLTVRGDLASVINVLVTLIDYVTEESQISSEFNKSLFNIRDINFSIIGNFDAGAENHGANRYNLGFFTTLHALTAMSGHVNLKNIDCVTVDVAGVIDLHDMPMDVIDLFISMNVDVKLKAQKIIIGELPIGVKFCDDIKCIPFSESVLIAPEQGLDYTVIKPIYAGQTTKVIFNSDLDYLPEYAIIPNGESCEGATYSVASGELTSTADNKICLRKGYPGIFSDSSEVIVTTISLPQSAPVSFANSTINKTYGDNVFTNKLTIGSDKVESTSINYSSNNKNVATVDKNGQVTIVGAGEATITASVPESSSFAFTEVSYVLNVVKRNIRITANTVTVSHGDDINIDINAYSVTSGVLDNGDIVKGSLRLANGCNSLYIGTFPNCIESNGTFMVVSSNGKSKTANYNIQFVRGTVIVTAKKVEDPICDEDQVLVNYVCVSVPKENKPIFVPPVSPTSPNTGSNNSLKGNQTQSNNQNQSSSTQPKKTVKPVKPITKSLLNAKFKFKKLTKTSVKLSWLKAKLKTAKEVQVQIKVASSNRKWKTYKLNTKALAKGVYTIKGLKKNAVYQYRIRYMEKDVKKYVGYSAWTSLMLMQS